MENSLNESAHQHLFGLAIDPDILFSNHKGKYKKGIEKRQTKLAEKITYLEKFLAADEKIVCITTGCSPITFLEQYFMGIWIFYIKRCMLVFTNKRVLHIPTKTDYRYRNSIAQILYGDCKMIKISGRTLVVKYADNSKEKFYHIAGKELKKIKTFLKTVPLEGPQSATQKRTHLCPSCTAELITNEYTCPCCQLEFKNKAEARKISLIYPGGGYFYTRHPILGICDALTEIFLTSFIIISLIDQVRRIEGSYIVAIMFGIMLAVEKVVTIHDSSKFIDEYIPLDKNLDDEDIIMRSGSTNFR